MTMLGRSSSGPSSSYSQSPMQQTYAVLPPESRFPMVTVATIAGAIALAVVIVVAAQEIAQLADRNMYAF